MKNIEDKSKDIDSKAKSLSEKMSKCEYVITESMINPPLKKMWRIVRMMGFKNSETTEIIDSVRKDLIGKKMNRGDSFHELMKETFTKAITITLDDMHNKS